MLCWEGFVPDSPICVDLNIDIEYLVVDSATDVVLATCKTLEEAHAYIRYYGISTINFRIDCVPNITEPAK